MEECFGSCIHVVFIVVEKKGVIKALIRRGSNENKTMSNQPG